MFYNNLSCCAVVKQLYAAETALFCAVSRETMSGRKSPSPQPAEPPHLNACPAVCGPPEAPITLEEIGENMPNLTKDDIRSVLELIKELYLADKIPWICGYSGGKDSTAVVQLVWTALAQLPESQRHKPCPRDQHGYAGGIPRRRSLGHPVSGADAARRRGRRAAYSSPQAGSRGYEYLLGQPDRPGLSLSAPEFPLVYGPPENRSLQPLCQKNSGRRERGHPGPGHAEGRERHAQSGHGGV